MRLHLMEMLGIEHNWGETPDDQGCMITRGQGATKEKPKTIEQQGGRGNNKVKGKTITRLGNDDVRGR